MYVDLSLNSGQKATESTPNSKYVYLAKGEQVQVVCKPAGRVVSVRRGDQFEIPEGFDEVQITNTGSDGEISLLCSEVQFVPSLDGSKLAIEADVSTSEMSVVFKGRQPVQLERNAQVRAELTNLPEVLPVEVQNMPEPPVVQNVRIVDTRKASTKFIARDTMVTSGQIEGNTKRVELILKAAADNQGSIWLGGYQDKGMEIRPDGGFVLSNGAAVDVYIPSNCKLYVSEVTA